MHHKGVLGRVRDLRDMCLAGTWQRTGAFGISSPVSFLAAVLAFAGLWTSFSFSCSFSFALPVALLALGELGIGAGQERLPSILLGELVLWRVVVLLLCILEVGALVLGVGLVSIFCLGFSFLKFVFSEVGTKSSRLALEPCLVSLFLGVLGPTGL